MVCFSLLLGSTPYPLLFKVKKIHCKYVWREALRLGTIIRITNRRNHLWKSITMRKLTGWRSRIVKHNTCSVLYELSKLTSLYELLYLLLKLHRLDIYESIHIDVRITGLLKRYLLLYIFYFFRDGKKGFEGLKKKWNKKRINY